MDISDTIAPTSDQLDAVDLLAGPRTFTVEKVARNNGEQPVNIKLREFDRPWRPGKSMRRVLVACWGPDASTYVGRRLTLWCDPTVKFGGAAVGGVRITHLSNLDKPRAIPLLVTRGKSEMYSVRPLAEEKLASPAVQLQLRTDEAVSAYGNGGVSLEQLERKVGKARPDWSAEDVDGLEALFGQLKRREVTKDEVFPVQKLEGESATDPGDYDASMEDGYQNPEGGQ